MTSKCQRQIAFGERVSTNRQRGVRLRPTFDVNGALAQTHMCALHISDCILRIAFQNFRGFCTPLLLSIRTIKKRAIIFPCRWYFSFMTSMLWQRNIHLHGEREKMSWPELLLSRPHLFNARSLSKCVCVCVAALLAKRIDSGGSGGGLYSHEKKREVPRSKLHFV